MLKATVFALIGSAAIFFGTTEFIHWRLWSGVVLSVGGFLIVHSDASDWARFGRVNSEAFGRLWQRTSSLPQNSSNPPSRAVRPWRAALSVLAVLVAAGTAARENAAQTATTLAVASGIILVQALLLLLRGIAHARRLQ